MYRYEAENSEPRDDEEAFDDYDETYQDPGLSPGHNKIYEPGDLGRQQLANNREEHHHHHHQNHHHHHKKHHHHQHQHNHHRKHHLKPPNNKIDS